jgi:hypothetical protein
MHCFPDDSHLSMVSLNQSGLCEGELSTVDVKCLVNVSYQDHVMLSMMFL